MDKMYSYRKLCSTRKLMINSIKETKDLKTIFWLLVNIIITPYWYIHGIK